MTFTTQIKEEITKEENNNIEDLTSLCTYLKFNATLEEDKMTVMVVNASVARWIFKLLKTNYNVLIKLTTRTMKRFKARNLYILEVKEKLDLIYKDIDNIFKEINTSSDEEKKAFLKGMFLACGSINDPKKLGYHMEFFIDNKSEASFVSNILNDFYINNKMLARDNNYMVYVKESEKIGDFLRIISANVALLYFEDIRIYRDHKNMTNRLNNCEQANVDKIVSSAQNQLNDIKKLEDVIGFDLLDEKLQEVIVYRKKYPDVSLNDLSIIMTEETGKTITKSGLNHRFRKIQEMAKKLDDK